MTIKINWSTYIKNQLLFHSSTLYFSPVMRNVLQGAPTTPSIIMLQPVEIVSL